MKILERSRTLRESENCRIKYGDPRSFDILNIKITEGSDVYVYQIEAKHLSTQTDSIHFYPTKTNGKLNIEWVKWAAPYIKLISKPKSGFFQKIKLFFIQLLSIFNV